MTEALPDWEAIYRASSYGFADEAGNWRWFALDGALPALPGLAGSVTLISAWNPGSVERAPAENQAAQARLERALRADGVRFTPAAGASLPGVAPAWREEGCALHGVGRAAARAWGREYGQRALVRLEPDAAVLLFCADGRAVRCGVRALPAPDRE
jgi:hypothetical protein